VSKRIEQVTGMSASKEMTWQTLDIYSSNLHLTTGIPEKNYESFQILKYEGGAPTGLYALSSGLTVVTSSNI